MATTQPHPAPAATTERRDQHEIKIVSHSNLFYWWPLWAVGFIMAGLTYLDGRVMAVVPVGSKVERHATVIPEHGQPLRDVDAIVPPPRKVIPEQMSQDPDKPHLRIAWNKSYGVFYTIVLILLIVISNVPLRGLWSVVVIVVIVLLSIIFMLAGWWEPILDALGRLRIHINFAGYVLISLALFVIWLITFLLFDPQIYMVFTPGQLRVRQEIGGGEAAYDTAGMVIQKQRNDLFRHWILGLGSGDLIVNTSGATAHHFDLPNVLFVGYKVKQIEDMLREKPVVQG